jgi:RNA polymerase sigma-70 factor (ECF subfamily)
MVDSFTDTLRFAQAGEEWAIASLWRDLQPRLLRFLAARNPRAADDVASETWLRVARNLRSFQGDEVEFRAWFFTIARRALIDWQRKTGRRPATVALDEMNEPQSPDDPITETIEAYETEHALELLGRLPEDQAEVILLRVIGGLDTTQVANLLQKRPGTVRVLQHRGLRRLAELLAAETPTKERVPR